MDKKSIVLNAWRWKCGLPEIETEYKNIGWVDEESLRKSEWSQRFEYHMRNRLVLGAIRYGKLHAPGKPEYDRIKSIERRLSIYKETGNLETLVDCANLCLLEFEESKHPKRNFTSIDDGEHVDVIPD